MPGLKIKKPRIPQLFRDERFGNLSGIYQGFIRDLFRSKLRPNRNSSRDRTAAATPFACGAAETMAIGLDRAIAEESGVEGVDGLG